MNTFDLHKEITEDYKAYISSFTTIKDKRIKDRVDEEFNKDSFLPEPLIQFNPAYEKGCALKQLIDEGTIHPDLDRVFKGFELHKHQEEAIRLGMDRGFVVTSGTGSGKSLTYLATIFNRILNGEKNQGIKGLLVYPMNALINSQEEEIHKYAINYLKSFLTPGQSWNENQSLPNQIKDLEKKTKKKFPVKYHKYTGQENEEQKDKVRNGHYDIILTNYMMLELIMTRHAESGIRSKMQDRLEFLVFDELHTYRGRQGADVAMLIRRINAFCNAEIRMIGTSATMATGTEEEKKNEVAKFASLIFGKPYTPEQIVTESLIHSTNQSVPLDQKLLRNTISNLDVSSNKEQDFYNNSLAVWIEKEIALKQNEDGSIDRGEPLTLSQIVQKLSNNTGETEEICQDSIVNLLLWGEKLNIEATERGERKTFLPFKIHQFISQTGTVYVNLDSPDKREITLNEELYIKKGNKEEYLYPVLFSRYSGHDFICVDLDFNANKVKPRQTDDRNEKLTQDDFKELKKKKTPPTIEALNKGYIVFDEEDNPFWDNSMIEDLPGAWYKKLKDGQLKINPYHELFMPRKVFFNKEGYFSLSPATDTPLTGWYIPTGMLFDPTSGVIYDSRTSENTKLMRLGNEGRSTATTMTTISILKALQNQKEEKKKQKILSFTDNRQDASLQAGHFNDFIGVVRLRSAIFHALQKNEKNTLEVENIARVVKEQLNLKESEFARKPNDENPNPYNQKALEKYLFYKVLSDLKRGWRYILPNLELCGLLKIQFKGYEKLANEEKLWKEDVLLSKMDTVARADFLYQILNYFRQSFAIDHRFFDQDELQTNQKLIEDNLDTDKIWSLNQNEKLDQPNALFIKQLPEKRKKSVFFMSAGTKSKLGKYIKRKFDEHNIHKLSGEDLEQYIEHLFNQLKKHSFLVADTVKYDEEVFYGYKLNLQVLQWTLGDGKQVQRDDVNYHYFREVEIKPNFFFQKFYQQDFSSYQASLVAREHTGQIDKDDRIEREKDFREGNIAALFCSPTMELGIDISELNVVHLRNVPPSPANYAQRSGRAGRSGQTALILNYCALGSPHDRHYFKHSKHMVAGVVAPPRIDLTNKDLLHAHINAYLFMEMKLDNVRESIGDLLAIQDDPESEFPIREEIANVIKELISSNEITYFENITAILNGIAENGKMPSWYNDEWVLGCIRQFYDNLNEAFNRWRTLFRNAIIERNNAQKIINDFAIRETHSDKKEARKADSYAQKQITLLLYQQNKDGQKDSEFYIFRYLASEGFFPGYNFVRLPIRSFLGKRNQGGVFISRPRFIALREFGPQNIIYHNGNKYRIKKLLLPNNQLESNKTRLKICKESGYAFFGTDGDGVNNDPITTKPLDGGDRVRIFKDMVEVTETTAEPQERISSQEEERMRLGYQIDLYFNFPEGLQGAQKNAISHQGDDILNMWFYKAAKLIEVNHRWKASKRDGFLINKNNGVFEQQRNVNGENQNDIATTRLYTTDTADMALIQPVDVLNLSEEGVISLAYALKRAIERLYQVEESEIGVQIIGDSDAKNILIFEASEGSLGILSQISNDRHALHEVFEEAYRVCHFDPDTRKDTRADIGPASYEDILSYYNQMYHDKLDRFAIKEGLERLMDCDTNNTRHFNNRKDNLKYLYDNYDRMSVMEKKFIDALEKYDGRLPDKAQVNLSGIANTYASADFYYSDDKVLIFIDGNVHDREDVANADNTKRRALRNAGFTVIVWNYKEPVEAFLEKNKHIFNCKKLK